MSRALPYLYVTIQFACLFTLMATGPILPLTPLPMLLVLFGVTVGVWGVIAMRLGNLSVLPDVRPYAKLVTRGPYRVIRHPMYASLILISLGWVIANPQIWRWAVLALLAVDLMLKLTYEEGKLVQHFPSYRDYQGRTARLIPWIW